MNIKRENHEVVIRIPLKQRITNPYMEDEDMGEIDNIVGVIIHRRDGDISFDNGIYKLIDMDYKDKPPQLGMPLVMLDEEEDEIRKLCIELGMDVWEFNSCQKCGETLFGTHTIDTDGKLICLDCKDTQK